MMKLLNCIAILYFASSVAQAADFFTEDFSGGNLGTNLAIIYGAANVDASGGDVKFTGTTDATRGGIGTNDSDYASVDFIATIDITDNDDVFVGMGPGTSTQPNFFGEPATGPTIFMRIGDTFKGDVYLYTGTETQLLANADSILKPNVIPITNVKMINSEATDMLEFLYSTDGGANFISAGSVDYGATTLGTTTSKIFAVGGNSPGSIDNFSVQPTTPIPLRFLTIEVGDDELNPEKRKVNLTWTGIQGKTYSLFSSTDLLSGNWIEIDDTITPVDGIVSYTHRDIDPTIPELFYQAREKP